MSLFSRIADHRDPGSLASRLRQRRHEFFLKLLETLPRPISILDVGGTSTFWKNLALKADDARIVLLNVFEQSPESPNTRSIAGDARDLRQFADNSFDIVYSNSVIEHVGLLPNQRQMANEIRRVGKRYFVQTPNAYFPIEPHFLVPGYQFMPLPLKTLLLTKSRLGWTPREPDWERAKEIAGSIRLLTISEMVALFPEATMYRERFAGLTKSVIAYHGW
jgi:Methyltransferase domain